MTELEATATLWRDLQSARVYVSETRTAFLAALVDARNAGYSQDAVGDHLGISRQRVGQLETVARGRRMIAEEMV